MSSENLHQSKISVIVPVYKAAGTLEACIKSIQKQTYQNLEIILVDDGSPDISGEICNKFAKADARIKVIRQENSGVSVARNNGIKEVSAEWLCFVDSDDEITPDYVEKLAEAQFKCDAQLTVGGMSLYHKHETKCVCEHDRECVLAELSYDELADICGKWIMTPMVSKLFNKRIIIDNNLQFENGLVCGEDHLFIFEYLNHCEKIAFTDANIYRYHCYHSNGKSRFFPLKGQIKIFEAKMHLLQKHCSKEDVETYCANKALHNLNVRVNYLAKKQKEDNAELQQAYDYYWRYISPFKGNESVFDKEDWEWLKRNSVALNDGDIKALFKDAFKLIKAKKSARKNENIKEVLAMPFNQKMRFILKKIKKLLKL